MFLPARHTSSAGNGAGHGGGGSSGVTVSWQGIPFSSFPLRERESGGHPTRRRPRGGGSRGSGPRSQHRGGCGGGGRCGEAAGAPREGVAGLRAAGSHPVRSRSVPIARGRWPGGRWLPEAPRTVTCLREAVVRPLPRQASLRHRGRRSLGGPSAAGASREGRGGRAPRRKATVPADRPEPGRRGPSRKTSLWATCTSSGNWACAVPARASGSPGFLRDSEAAQASRGGPAGGRWPRRWLSCSWALVCGRNLKAICAVLGRLLNARSVRK